MNRREWLKKSFKHTAVAAACAGVASASRARDTVSDVAESASQQWGLLSQRIDAVCQQLVPMRARLTRLEARQMLMFAWLMALSAFTGFDFVTPALLG